MGTKAKWVSGRLNFYSDGVEFSTGGYVHLKSGTYKKDDNINSITASGDIDNYGISLLLSSTNAIYNLQSPTVSGMKKILVAHSTVLHIVRATSAVATGAFGAPGSTLHSMTIAPTSKLKARGIQVHLIGTSTVLWEVLSASTNSVTFTTQCT